MDLVWPTQRALAEKTCSTRQGVSRMRSRLAHNSRIPDSANAKPYAPWGYTKLIGSGRGLAPAQYAFVETKMHH